MEELVICRRGLLGTGLRRDCWLRAERLRKLAEEMERERKRKEEEERARLQAEQEALERKKMEEQHRKEAVLQHDGHILSCLFGPINPFKGVKRA